MRCPFCHENNDRVVDSRGCQSGTAVRRRRECLHCGRRYTTYEQVGETTLRVVKRDGSRVPFQREKVLESARQACCKRPVTAEHLDQLVCAVENILFEEGDVEVPSRYIGDLVLEQLQLVDPIAYVRFASAHYNFTCPEDFARHLPAQPEVTPKPR